LVFRQLPQSKGLVALITAVDIRQKAMEEAISLGAKIGGFDVPR
jgi:hypothetical protein